MIGNGFQSAEVGTLSGRSSTDPRSRWNLEHMYPGDEGWRLDLDRLLSLAEAVPQYRGRLSESGEKLLEWLRFYDELGVLAGKVVNYAFRRFDEDTTSAAAQEMMNRASALEAEISAATSWVAPELLAVDPGRIAGFLRDTPGLEAWSHAIDDTLRRRPHIRAPEVEHELARAQDALGAPATIFEMFNEADIRFGEIRDEEDRPVEVTKGRYLRLQESQDRRVRRDAYNAFYGAYAQWKNTLAAALAGHVKRDMFYARARDFPSTREMAMFSNNIPPEVYDNVLAAVRARLEPLHRSVALRKTLLGVDCVEPWDLFVPLTREPGRPFPFDEAAGIVLASVAPLGSEYADAVRSALTGGWIDVYESVGKASGAYSSWTYGTHPYILLNHAETIKDLFTLAHEMGHAMHSHFTGASQPPAYAGYTIFCAEVASTFNEMLLMHHLLESETDPAFRFHLLMHHIETIRGTIYNQALFADFELRAHAHAWSGGALTAEYFGAVMRELYAEYYGPDFHLAEHFDCVWSRIPHFYRSFYVYQYATGLSAAIALARQVLRGDAGARDRYLGFLRAGNSRYSIDLLRDAGVDMLTPGPIEEAASLMDELITEAYRLLPEVRPDARA